MSLYSRIDRYFGASEAGSSVQKELRAGVTTFLTMAYILFVNPAILSQGITLPGQDATAQILTATALSAAFGSIVMGLVARYPFALAPGMGLNAYFTFSVIKGLGVPWQVALGAVFISGLIFLVISVTGLREMILNGIPISLKRAISAGIGLFLAIIGCTNAGFIKASPATLVTLGDLHNPAVWLALLGILFSGGLLAMRARGAILLGVLAIAAIACFSGAPVFNGKPFAGLPSGIIAAPHWPSDLFLALDIKGAFEFGIVGIVLTFTFVELFDTAGTLIGLADRGGYLDINGHLKRASRAFAADAIATSAGALLGTSTTTAYIESASGIQDGGRTGLTSVVTGILFACAIFMWPMASLVPAVATAPALIIVGAMMMASARHIDWDDYMISIPAFLTMAGMPFTFSIANGVSFGIVTHTGLHVVTGKWRQLHPIMIALTIILALRFV